ncbi:MAG: type II toxin-antitoxin system VapC family toxin [Planctomycetes bacterium]|nr:type II toxin-antitoxin system VapC family toxin [Planctomycetota bacterium]
MTLASGIPDGASVLIDTNPLIYHLEGNPLAERFAPIFAAVDRGRIRAMVTPITVAEVVTGPLKAGKEALAQRYLQLLTANRGWTLFPIDADLALLSARLRLKYRLKLPDALQLGAALQSGCYAIVSHDRDFSRVTDIPILGLG